MTPPPHRHTHYSRIAHSPSVIHASPFHRPGQAIEDFYIGPPNVTTPRELAADFDPYVESDFLFVTSGSVASYCNSTGKALVFPTSTATKTVRAGLCACVCVCVCICTCVRLCARYYSCRAPRFRLGKLPCSAC